MNAIIYIRVSSEEQAKFGYSLGSQKDLCNQFAKQNGYDVIKEFMDDGFSAKDLNRPALKDLMLFCKKKNKVDALIVWKLDRLCRNMTDYHSTILPLLAKNNMKLLSTTEGNDESISGDLARNIWMSFAEYERKLIGMRTSVGMKAKAEKGYFPPRAPIGYKDFRASDGQHIIIPDESRALYIRRAFELYSSGSYTLETLKTKLTEEGLTTRRTKAINKATLHNILKNPVYMGSFVWRGKRYDNAKHKPIIKPSLFYKVQDVLNGKNNPRNKKHNFSYTNLLKCECGRKLTAEKQRGHVYYICSGKKNKLCTMGKYIREEKLEEKFLEIFKAINISPELAKELNEQVRKVYKDFNTQDTNSVEALTNEIVKIEKKLDQLYEDKLEGIIDLNFFNKKQNEYNSLLSKIKIQIENKMESSKQRYKFADNLIELFKNAPELYLQSSYENRRTLLNLVTSNIYIKGEELHIELKPVFYELSKSAIFKEKYPGCDSNA